MWSHVWSHTGIVLESYWNSIVVESYWNHTGIILESVPLKLVQFHFRFKVKCMKKDVW